MQKLQDVSSVLILYAVDFMANLLAIHSVGSSLIYFLENSYPQSLRTNHACGFRLLSSNELSDFEVPETPTLSLFLHQITINEHWRNTTHINSNSYKQTPLAVDLHYLMTVWAKSALKEQLIMAWAMHQLHQYPLLDKSFLSSEAEWEAEEMIQIIPTDLTNEEMMRIWDKLQPTYRLSVAYVARVVRINPVETEDAPFIVASRFVVGKAGI